MDYKKSLIDRLELIKVESGHSDKAFKSALAEITGKTPRTIRRWYSLQSSIHESDIETIASHFGKHVHWLRYGDRKTLSPAVDQIMSSNHFGAIILRDNQIEDINFKLLEMFNLDDTQLSLDSLMNHITRLQPNQSLREFRHGLDHALNKGAHVEHLQLYLGDNCNHHIESTTLNLNNGRLLRILFDNGVVNNCKPTSPTDIPRNKNSQEAKLNVLFVDDDPATCQLYVSVLSLHQCEVTAHVHPDEALAEFTNNPQKFDVMITDLFMPVMTGDSLASRCREIKPDLPVILCSGYTNHLKKTTAKEFGVSHYLEKPVDSLQLLEALKQYR